MALPTYNKDLCGLVDMGSNGIRFSVTDLAASRAQLLPTLFTSRSPISIYDAQHSSASPVKVALRSSVIESVVVALKGFQQTCEDFRVSPDNLYVFATEATREAPNSEEFVQSIRSATGLSVRVLDKEEEGRLGAIGILSSINDCRGGGRAREGQGGGLCVDLGGGSCQLTWLPPGYEKPTFADLLAVKEQGGGRVSTTSVPLGAAALLSKIGENGKVGAANERKVDQEIASTLQMALSEVGVCDADAHGTSGIEQARRPQKDDTYLYLSGGGLRAWGHLLMSTHSSLNHQHQQSSPQPYPIETINGYVTTPNHLLSLINNIPSPSTLALHPQISTRRATQLPATARLLRSLLATLPSVSRIVFAQGGLREGALYSLIKPDVVTYAHPLWQAANISTTVGGVLHSALRPSPAPNGAQVPSIIPIITVALVDSLHKHSAQPKDTRASAALRSTTTGDVFAQGDHGITHGHRAALAVALCERWGGYEDLPVCLSARRDSWEVTPGQDRMFYHALQQHVLTPEETWWAVYIGRVAALVGEVYPAGEPQEDQDDKERLEIESYWAGQSKKGYAVLRVDLTFRFLSEAAARELYSKPIKGIEKIGKKKNWPLASDDVDTVQGIKTDVRVFGMET